MEYNLYLSDEKKLVVQYQCDCGNLLSYHEENDQWKVCNSCSRVYRVIDKQLKEIARDINTILETYMSWAY